MNGTSTGPVKCAIWMRVSTGRQETSNQAPDIERFVATRGYEVAERYELKDSAWNGGKEGGEYRATLKQAMDDAWAGKFSVLVVWALDRLTREGSEGLLRINREFRERGCTIYSVKDTWMNTTPEIQDVLIAFDGWRAHQSSQRNSERIKAGMARRKAEGKPVGGRPKGTKDARPRHTAGYKAVWRPGGALSEAAKARERTWTCQNRECGKEFTTTSPTPARHCSQDCANAVRAYHRSTEGARLALQVFADAGEPMGDERERLARLRAADPDESWAEVAQQAGMTRAGAINMHRLMMVQVGRMQREVQAAAEQAATVSDALAVLTGAGIEGAGALLAQHAGQAEGSGEEQASDAE